MFHIYVLFYTSWGILTYLDRVFKHILLAEIYTKKFWFLQQKFSQVFVTFCSISSKLLLADFLQVGDIWEGLQPIWGIYKSNISLPKLGNTYPLLLFSFSHIKQA
jgi:hypothetical protein